MADTAELARHIKSINQTRQITRAMFLTSSSKMRKVLQACWDNSSFSDSLDPVLRAIIDSGLYKNTKAFSTAPPRKTAYIVITSDQGLAGSYNSDVLSMTAEHMADKDVSVVYATGSVGAEHFKQRRCNVSMELRDKFRTITIENARFVAQTLVDEIDTDLFDEVFIVYTRVESAAHQYAAISRLLPFRPEDYKNTPSVAGNAEMRFLPEPDVVIKQVIKLHIAGRVYGAAVQSFAAEQCLRMQSMDAATRNADKMIYELSLRLNRSRQEAITQEITEIVSGYLS